MANETQTKQYQTEFKKQKRGAIADIGQLLKQLGYDQSKEEGRESKPFNKTEDLRPKKRRNAVDVTSVDCLKI